MDAHWNKKVEFKAFQTIVVGSGAAGLNAALMLWKQGITDIAILSEGLNYGTSRNTGSDKQTYYKLTTSGSEPDSVRRMAEALFSGGCMDGDLALAEAAASTRAFYHLVEIGVPFPCTPYGEYVGYKTDHDPCKRGISAGPLTSKYMTECLIREIQERNIPVFEGWQVIELLTEQTEAGKRAVGVLAMKRNQDLPEFFVISSNNVVYATGGEAGMYQTSVYPAVQTGGTGVALRAGVRGKNLTESQFGIASIKFRWNLSGSYQQVLPRYVSTDKDGNDEREFLQDYFETPEQLLAAIFFKGYQWPFDPRKIEHYGSSLIDVLIYIETVKKKRRVFLDYRRNPSWAMKDGKMDFSRLNEESKEYLTLSNALQETPIERLAHMNPAAIELYRSHHIDLYHEMLEVAICAQHNNGGLVGNCWWESNIAHFFPVGEVNGTHGVYRPGGSALNSGQVAGIRVSQYIANNYREQPYDREALERVAGQSIEAAMEFGHMALERRPESFDLVGEYRALQERMSRCAAVIRNTSEIQTAIQQAKEQIHRIETQAAVKEPKYLHMVYRLRDLAVSQLTYLSAIADYIAHGGKSRGSYLIYDSEGVKPLDELEEEFRYSLENGALSDQIQEVEYDPAGCHFMWRNRRPIPEENEWFETVWSDWRNGVGFH